MFRMIVFYRAVFSRQVQSIVCHVFPHVVNLFDIPTGTIPHVFVYCCAMRLKKKQMSH